MLTISILVRIDKYHDSTTNNTNNNNDNDDTSV